MEKNDAQGVCMKTGEGKLYEYLHNMSGHFYTKLFAAIAHADGENLERLGKGFPEEVEAYTRYTLETGYWDNLKKRYEALGGRSG